MMNAVSHNRTTLARVAHEGGALALATYELNDAVNDHVVALAQSNGSKTPASVRFIHFANATARAIGLPKSNAEVIADLPIQEQAILALVRDGIAQRIPAWAAQAEAEGGDKPHNRILHLAKQWATEEVAALRANRLEEVVSLANTLLTLESHHG